MSKVTHVDENVIYIDFSITPITHQRKVPTGVFIRPPGSDVSLWTSQPNMSGYIASHIAFHHEFSPSLFGTQMRDELGFSLANDEPEPPDAA